MNTSLYAPQTGLAIYNPDLLRKEDLIVQFVARQSLLELLLEDLQRAGASGGIQHHLIIGQRGMGKTTLLRRLRFAIEDDPALSKRWFPLTFPEEQYNITRMSDFWANCLDALGDMLDEQGRENEAEQLDEAVKNLPADEQQRSRVALAMLTQWAEGAGKGLVLLLDNADLILERLSKHHWELREVLSHNDRLVCIGATPAPISATYEYAGAFYDFFQAHQLRGLNIEETRAVLLTLAELRRTPHVADIVEGDPGRMQALRVLTGGNPRVLVVLYQVLAQERDGSVISELEQILDLHTPYYKAVFEALATQAQQVAGALCLHWHPISAAALAALPSVRLETNIVSAQLDRLTKDGVVEKAPTPPGEKLLYQIAERFFNIWYLMRASRRLRRKLIWLVDFLRIFYASTDLHERAHRFLKAAPIPRRADMAFAYAQAVDEPALRHALEYEGIRSMLSERREYREALGSMFDFEVEDASLKTRVERIAELHEIRQCILHAKVKWPDCTAEEFWQRLGGSWALNLAEKKHIAANLKTFSEQEIRGVLKDIARKQRHLFALLGLERSQTLMEAIRSGDMADVTDVEGADAAAIRLGAPSLKAIARLEDTRKKQSPPPSNDLKEIRQSIALDPDYAYPLYSLGALLAEHPDLRSEAETCYRKGLEVFPTHPYLWDGLGVLLAEYMERYEEAEAAYRKAIELDPSNAWSWTNLGNLLSDHLKRYEEAEAAYRKAIELDPYYAWPWTNLGNLLFNHLKRYEEAEVAYRKAIELDSRNAWPWNGLGALLHYKCERYEEAEAAYRKATELDSRNAWAWTNLGNLLSDHLKRYEEAEAAYRKAIELDPHYTWSWNGLGTLLHYERERYEEAEAAYRKAIELDPNWATPRTNLGNLLSDHLKRYEEAEAAYRKAIELDSRNAWPWNGLGVLLHYKCKRYEEAEAAYRKATELDPSNAWSWTNLGKLLSGHLKRYGEAEAAYRRAVDIAPDEDTHLNNLAWFLFLVDKDIEEAEEKSRQALTISPDNLNIIGTLACILARQVKWEEAALMARRFIIEGDEDYHAGVWPGIVAFCKEAVTTEHAADAVELLDEIGFEDRWRPLREALRAVAAGSDAPLLRVAPEIRQPAEELVAQLLPEGAKLASAIKTPRAKRSRRKKII